MPFAYGAEESRLRPRCWGDDRYHNMNTRECRSCSYNMSCRDEIYRLRGYAQAPGVAPPPQQSYYPGYMVPPPGASQVPVHIGPPQPQQQVPARQQPALVQAYPPPQRYQYGWLTDPLYYTMSASPPPPRPQLEGENFVERVFKNMLLSAGEALCMHAFLAMRQLVMAPGPEEPAASTRVVDVKPMGPQTPGTGST